jgi:hypothetical protein
MTEKTAEQKAQMARWMQNVERLAGKTWPEVAKDTEDEIEDLRKAEGRSRPYAPRLPKEG